MDWKDGLVLEHTVSSTITGEQLLEVFKDKINAIGQIKYRKNHDWGNNDSSNFSYLQISASVSGSVLSLKTADSFSDTTTTTQNFGMRMYLESSFIAKFKMIK